MADKIIITVKITPSFPLWLQTSALALPLTFLAAGGCGGGGSNGVTVPPPVVVGSPTPIGGFVTPTPTPLAGTTPAPTATIDPNATPTPTATVAATATPMATAIPTPTPTPFSPNLNFTSVSAFGFSNELILDLRSSNSALQISVGRINGTNSEGQVFNVIGSFALTPGPAEASLSFQQGGGRWIATRNVGSVTLSRYAPGTITPAGDAGRVQMRVANVRMQPIIASGARDPFILNGTFTATNGSTGFTGTTDTTDTTVITKTFRRSFR